MGNFQLPAWAAPLATAFLEQLKGGAPLVGIDLGKEPSFTAGTHFVKDGLLWLPDSGYDWSTTCTSNYGPSPLVNAAKMKELSEKIAASTDKYYSQPADLLSLPIYTIKADASGFLDAIEVVKAETAKLISAPKPDLNFKFGGIFNYAAASIKWQHGWPSAWTKPIDERRHHVPVENFDGPRIQDASHAFSAAIDAHAAKYPKRLYWPVRIEITAGVHCRQQATVYRHGEKSFQDENTIYRNSGDTDREWRQCIWDEAKRVKA